MDDATSGGVRIEQRERLITSTRVRADRVVLSRPRGGGREQVERIVHDHGSCATVLPVDVTRRVVMLIRQLRLPVFVEGEAALIAEPCAGLIDEGEDAAQAMRREAMEEMGLRLDALEKVATVYTSPGFTTERATLFLAQYTPSDRIEDGGGLAEEGEHIEVLEWPLSRLADELAAGRIRDGKLLMLTQALMLRRRDLFS